MMSFEGDTLSWAPSEDVLEVRLHRAPANEIGEATVDELSRLVDLLHGGAGAARAVLIFSEQRAGFGAGADLRALYAGMQAHDDPERAFEQVEAFLRRIHRVMDGLDTAPVPTVAALHGVVFGGGLELALTADVRVADRSARLAFPELRLGLIPGFGGIPRLEREVGQGVVRDLLFTGRSLNARRAHALGLVSQVTPAGAHVDAARRTARQAARFDPSVIAEAKAFTKPLPRERLDAELATFLRLLRAPRVEEALARFVHSDDVRPYLP